MSSSRTSEILADIPVANKCTLSLCIACYAYQIVQDPPLIHYTLCPRNVIYLHEWYRILTSAFFHGGFLHIAMNMMAVMGIGSTLEKRFGTLRHIFNISWGVILTSVVYILVAWGLSFFFHYDDLIYQNSVGFSCILFQLSVLEANLISSQHYYRTRSVLGLVQVPVRLYPWAMLFAIQIMMPHISFMGHLSGILIGTLQIHGVFDFIFPSDSFLRQIEEWNSLRFITNAPGFKATPSDSILNSLYWRGGVEQRPSIISVLCQACKVVFIFIKNVAETIKVCIFGYGPISSIFTGTTDSTTNEYDDDREWQIETTTRRTPTTAVV